MITSWTVRVEKNRWAPGHMSEIFKYAYLLPEQSWFSQKIELVFVPMGEDREMWSYLKGQGTSILLL